MRLLRWDVQLINMQALVEHENIDIEQIYTYAAQERLSKFVEAV